MYLSKRIILVGATLILGVAFTISGISAGGRKADILVTPTNIELEQDDRVATISWNDFPKLSPKLTAGVSGYQVKWGMAERGFDKTVLVQMPVTQLQPLENGRAYMAQIRAIDQ